MQLTRPVPTLQFTKVASQFLLSDNQTTHSSELLAHLYKQHPYLGQYQVNMSVEGQDERAGYMYGMFMVTQAIEAPTNQMGQGMGGTMQPPPTNPEATTLRIPVIVANKKAYSFDVFITSGGKFLPLSEPRVAQALFDASPYGVSSDTEQTIQSGDAMQEYRADAGANMAFGRAAHMTKVAQLIDPDAAREFARAVLADPALAAEARGDTRFAHAFRSIEDRQHPVKVASTTERSDAPDVAVLTKIAGGYEVLLGWQDGEVTKQAMSNAQAENMPADIRQLVNTRGTLMVTNNASPLRSLEKVASIPYAEDTGVYSVMDRHGNLHKAVVFSGVHTLDGRVMGGKLVLAQAGVAVQERVAGTHIGPANLSSVQGKLCAGDGVLLVGEQVYEPIKISHVVYKGGEVESAVYEHPLDGRGHLKLADVQRPTRTVTNDFLIPKTATFIQARTARPFVDDAVSFSKVANHQAYRSAVSIKSDGTEYTLSGNVPDVFGGRMKVAQALLVLGLLGDTADGAKERLERAASVGEAMFVPTKQIGLVGAVKEASAPLDVTSIRVDLVKEAAAMAKEAAMSSPDTVDSVLSLNFITPENVQGYLDSLPDLERSVGRLAEMLIGVRLGLSDIPESAVSAALNGMERAIVGLKKLQIRVGMENRA